MEMARTEDKLQTVRLRSRGHSYGYISNVVKISKSTLSDWLSDIPYTPNGETIRRIGKARAASGEAKSRIKQESVRQATEEAKQQLGEVSQRDLFMLGLGLYIGEGSKTAEITRFVNSDPAAVNLMIRWFVKALGVPKGNLRVRIHLYPDCNEKRSLRYWSKVTTIPLDQFQKSSFDRRHDKKVNKSGKLLHGTAHVSLKSLGQKQLGVFLFRKIGAWSNLVLNAKHAGVV